MNGIENMYANLLHSFNSSIRVLIYIWVLVFCFVDPLLAKPVSPGPAAIKIESPREFGEVFIAKMVQDRHDFLWFATNQGLWRFDGLNLKKYQHAPDNANSVMSNGVISIVEDLDGYIWLIYENNGLSRLDPITEQFLHFVYDGKTNTISSNNLLGLNIDRFGKLWIGAINGINIFDTRTFNNEIVGLDMQPLKGKTGPHVFYAFPDSEGNIWMTVRRQGLFRYDKLSKEVVKFEHDPDDVTTKGNGLPTTVFEDDSGTIWVTSNGELNRYNKDSNTFTRFQVSKRPGGEAIGISPTSIAQLENEQLLVGTYGFGLGIMDKAANNLELLNPFSVKFSDSITDFRVWSILVDRNGVAWISAFPSGLYKVPAGARVLDFYALSQDVEEQLQAVIDLPGGRYLIGSSNSLYEYDVEQTRFTKIGQDVSDVRAMAKGEWNDIFLLLEGRGVHKLDSKTGKMEPVYGKEPSVPLLKEHSNVAALAYNNDILYAGLFHRSNSRAGVVSFNTKTTEMIWHKTTLPITHLQIWQDQLLAGTGSDGVMMMDLKSGEWTTLMLKGTKGRSVSSLFKDSQGTLWLGINTLGLSKLDPNNPRLDFLTVEDGLPSNTIASITEDSSNNLWLGSQQGIAVLNPQDMQLVHFDLNDGFRGKGIGAYWSASTSSGSLLIGAYQWLTIFNPLEVLALKRQKKAPGKILLSDFRLFNKPQTTNVIDPQSPLPKTIHHLDELTLNHDDSWFSLAFSSSDYSQGDRLRYAYKMDGLKDKWIEADKGNQMVNFSSLPPKDYVLNIRSGDDNGWHDNVRQLKVSILPPWWQTWQAYVLYVVATLALVLGVFRYRTKALVKRAEALEKGIEERTATINQLMAQKDRMFANISHEFKTPLTLILNPLDNICRSQPQDEFDSKVSMMKRNSKRLLRMVDQLLELSKLETTDNEKRELYSLLETLNVLLLSFQPLIDSKSMVLSCNDYEDVILSLKPDALEIILTNLISNAIKYTPDEGKISIKVRKQGPQVSIAVKDSGIGIDKASQTLVFNRFTRAEDNHGENIPGAGIGLALVKELVESHGGIITLESEPGAGSTFTVVLPVTGEQQTATKNVTELSHSSQLEIDALNASSELSASDEEVASDENKETILLIDDNADMLALLTSTLADKFNCVTAQNGEDGLALAREQLPDLVLSDVMMPGISGFEVVSRLKQDELTSHLPVVLLTAKGDTESRIRGWDEKADEYLEKPFDSRELRMRIDNLLEIRKLLRQRYLREFNEIKSSTEVIEPVVQEQAKVEGESLCESKSAQDIRLNKASQQFVDKLNNVLETHYQDETMDVSFLADKLAVSQRQLSRKMKAMLDLSPVESIRAYRLKKAAQLLADGHSPSVVAHQVGFSSHSYFSKCFKDKYGCLPSSYH